MFSVSKAAAALNARHLGGDAEISRVGSDSRTLAAGDLFVALRGERFDGHAYVAAAARDGAAAALVSDVAACGELPAGFPLLLVDDTRLALGRLGAWWRAELGLPLAAVTGSNGKTTVKEMLAAILAAATGDAAAVLATEGNLNNDIGVPLTLLRLRREHRYAVIEMGMNHAGEISYLTRLARPDAALVNNAGPAHLAGLGSVEAVARAKGEIFEGLGPDGIALYNADGAYAPLWRELAAGRRALGFGLEAGEITGRATLRPDGADLALRTPAGEVALRLAVPGLHNARNALAAAALAHALGVDNAAIAAGLAAYGGVKGRLQRKPGLHGASLIDDSYNANPASVSAAIAVLAALPGRRLLVLGDMGELGDDALELHRQIGRAARAAGIDGLYALGELARAAVEGYGAGARHYEFIEGLLHDVENLLAPDVTLLVKGSRFMRMERVVKSFEAAAEDKPCCS